jgi:hypothetical protein
VCVPTLARPKSSRVGVVGLCSLVPPLSRNSSCQGFFIRVVELLCTKYEDNCLKRRLVSETPRNSSKTLGLLCSVCVFVRACVCVIFLTLVSIYFTLLPNCLDSLKETVIILSSTLCINSSFLLVSLPVVGSSTYPTEYGINHRRYQQHQWCG